MSKLPASVLTKSQKKVVANLPIPLDGYGKDAHMTVTVRYDDTCGNGHNTFAITAKIRQPGARDIEAGGCLHDEIAKHCPELRPYIKWHLVSSDGPMHYVANTIYLAGDRDCHGLRKGEFRQHTSRGSRQNGGIEGVPNWVLELPDRSKCDVYSDEKPAPTTLEWKAGGRTGEGKAPELDAARRHAIWPEATTEQLTSESALLERLPALMIEFKAAMESLGFTY